METMSPITKYFLEPILKKSPISLETLNQGFLVCFAAYVIKKKQISEHDSYFRKNVQTNTEIYIRDLIYDVIHPNVPKELREAVDVITAENKYCDITEMTEFLLNNKLNIEDCQKIANDLAVHYYPMVITESITTPASINELCLSIFKPNQRFLLRRCSRSLFNLYCRRSICQRTKRRTLDLCAGKTGNIVRRFYNSGIYK